MVFFLLVLKKSTKNISYENNQQLQIKSECFIGNGIHDGDFCSCLCPGNHHRKRNRDYRTNNNHNYGMVYGPDVYYRRGHSSYYHYCTDRQKRKKQGLIFSCCFSSQEFKGFPTCFINFFQSG